MTFSTPQPSTDKKNHAQRFPTALAKHLEPGAVTPRRLYKVSVTKEASPGDLSRRAEQTPPPSPHASDSIIHPAITVALM